MGAKLSGLEKRTVIQNMKPAELVAMMAVSKRLKLYLGNKEFYHLEIQSIFIKNKILKGLKENSMIIYGEQQVLKMEESLIVKRNR